MKTTDQPTAIEAAETERGPIPGPARKLLTYVAEQAELYQEASKTETNPQVSANLQGHAQVLEKVLQSLILVAQGVQP